MMCDIHHQMGIPIEIMEATASDLGILVDEVGGYFLPGGIFLRAGSTITPQASFFA